MVMFQGRYTPSIAGGTDSSSSVQFGADVSQAPVFLDVEVIPSHSFARLMLALGAVVRLQSKRAERDHSAYQEWVANEYIKELPAQMAGRLVRLPGLLARREELNNQISKLDATINAYYGGVFINERRKFWKWLYDHNRDAWVVLDPIVSVQPDATFFEAFSQDESTYARVTLPHQATRSISTPICGTTNIDFSLSLERELSRTRGYRPLRLAVGAHAVALDTGVSSTIEKKIDLPESWVRGLVEVQAALSLAPINIQVSAAGLADVLALLDSKREKQGPRSLRFELTPGEPVRIVVEPWEENFVVSSKPYKGSEPRQIRVWGRRRLMVLKKLLPFAPQISVHLIDSGMPSFWSLEVDDVSLTVGLSGWTSQDWAGRARFSAMIPASAADSELTRKLVDHLAAILSTSPDDVAVKFNISTAEARLSLQRLCVLGLAMFDVTSGRYRWRKLFPAVDLQTDSEAGLEERRGVALFRESGAKLLSDSLVHGHREVESIVISEARENRVKIKTDEDGRVVYAQCDCSHFRYHKLRQGPCRHIVATSLQAG